MIVLLWPNFITQLLGNLPMHIWGIFRAKTLANLGQKAHLGQNHLWHGHLGNMNYDWATNRSMTNRYNLLLIFWTVYQSTGKRLRHCCHPKA